MKVSVPVIPAWSSPFWPTGCPNPRPSPPEDHGVMGDLPKSVTAVHAALHWFAAAICIFLRFYPGSDGSRSISNTFDVHKLALGWFETWIQWGFWATLLYFISAGIVDFLKDAKWRRQRDLFFSLVFSIEFSILIGYWAIQVPVEVGIGIGTPSHSNWEMLVEHYISPTIPPVLAMIEFLSVSHRPGNFIVELIFVAVYAGGFIITDFARHALTHRFVFEIQNKSPGGYWAILAVLAFLAYFSYRGLSILLLRLRRRWETCYDILYDSDFDDDSVESRRKLINEDLSETLRFGRLDGQEGASCLTLSIPAIAIYVIIQTITLCFLVNYLVRARESTP